MVSRRLDKLSAGNALLKGNKTCLIIRTTLTLLFLNKTNVWKFIFILFYVLGLALNNKFLPVHCVVARDECPQRVLQDGFVIIPAHTKFHDIVAVVLRSMEADVGKIEHDERIDGRININKKNNLFFLFSGEILIKNWNPLPIETVTENRTVTVQDILGDLMNIAVLQIRISK